MSPAERVMLGYAEKVALDPTSVRRSDLDELRSTGWDDTGILQINLIASMFSYFNRVADGLGLGRP